MAYFSAEKRTRNMSGIDFARSDLFPGLLCELVLKDEFTFQIPALEIFPKTGARGSYPLQTKISAKFWTLCRQMAENVQKYIP